MVSSQNKTSGGRTIFWWIMWIAATIVSFFVAHMIWTPIIADKLGSIREGHNALIWVTAVFGTWLVILFPLIVVMYSKVDKTYEDSRIRREKAANRFRTLTVEKNKRLLPSAIQEKIKAWPPAIDGGHLATLTLRDGRKVEHVFVSGTEEILGIYGEHEFSFEGNDVSEAEPTDMNKLPRYVTANWLRLDGVAAPE